MRANGQTDMAKPIVAFRKFTKARKNLVNKFGLYTRVSDFLTLGYALLRLKIMSSVFSLDHY